MSRNVKELTYNIKGKNWKFIFLTTKTYEKKHGDDSDGIADVTTRTVTFDKEVVTTGIVRHELMHVWVESSNTGSSDLKPDQVEEMCAVIFQEHGLEMCMLADQIVEDYKRLERGDDEDSKAKD